MNAFGEDRLIALSRNKYARVSSYDYAWLKRWNWCVQDCGGHFIAVATAKGKPLMHRLILAAGDSPLVVDHIDGDPLNNTRRNLRLVTHQQNSWNNRGNWGGCKYRGVTFSKSDGYYRPRIKAGGKHRSLGSFRNAAEAGAAYLHAAVEAWGDLFPLEHHLIDDEIRTAYAELQALKGAA